MVLAVLVWYPRSTLYARTGLRVLARFVCALFLYRSARGTLLQVVVNTRALHFIIQAGVAAAEF